jgi:hypothetical protein
MCRQDRAIIVLLLKPLMIRLYWDEEQECFGLNIVVWRILVETIQMHRFGGMGSATQIRSSRRSVGLGSLGITVYIITISTAKRRDCHNRTTSDWGVGSRSAYGGTVGISNLEYGIFPSRLRRNKTGCAGKGGRVRKCIRISHIHTGAPSFR